MKAAPRELPVVACTLPPEKLRDRRGEWAAALRAGEAVVARTAGGVRVTMRATEQLAGEVRRLAALEADCCGFARWTVSMADGMTVLDVSAEGQGAAAVRAMFGQEETPA